MVERAYENRKHPTIYICPKCFRKDRQSMLNSENYGGGDFRFTCSDYSICSYAITLAAEYRDGQLHIPEDLHKPNMPILP